MCSFTCELELQLIHSSGGDVVVFCVTGAIVVLSRMNDIELDKRKRILILFAIPVISGAPG